MTRRVGRRRTGWARPGPGIGRFLIIIKSAAERTPGPARIPGEGCARVALDASARRLPGEKKSESESLFVLS